LLAILQEVDVLEITPINNNYNIRISKIRPYLDALRQMSIMEKKDSLLASMRDDLLRDNKIKCFPVLLSSCTCK